MRPSAQEFHQHFRGRERAEHDEEHPGARPQEARKSARHGREVLQAVERGEIGERTVEHRAVGGDPRGEVVEPLEGGVAHGHRRLGRRGAHLGLPTGAHGGRTVGQEHPAALGGEEQRIVSRAATQLDHARAPGKCPEQRAPHGTSLGGDGAPGPEALVKRGRQGVEGAHGRRQLETRRHGSAAWSDRDRLAGSRRASASHRASRAGTSAGSAPVSTSSCNRFRMRR